MNKMQKILISVLAFSSFWIFNSANSASLPAATHPIFFGYYKIDESRYGDFKDEVKDFVNTFLMEADPNPAALDEAFKEITAFGQNHKIILGWASDPLGSDVELNVAKNYWSSVTWIYLADEPNWDKATAE